MKTNGTASAAQELAAHGAPVASLSFGPDGRTLVSGDVARQVMLWQGDEVALRLDLASRNDKVRPTERMRSIVVAPSGDRFFVSSRDRLKCYGLDGGELWNYWPPRLWAFLIVSPYRIACSNAGTVASSFDNGTLGVWTLDGKKIALWGDNDSPRTLGFLQDGQRLIGSDGFSVCVWDPEIRAKVGKFVPGERIFGFAVHPGKDLVAVRQLDRILVYDANNGDPITDVATPDGLPLVAFQPQGDLLAIGAKHSVGTVDPSGRGTEIAGLGSIRATSLAWAPDGRRLAVGCSDGAVRIYPVG